jgi:ADP-heptose:LPS heptosyltransferase
MGLAGPAPDPAELAAREPMAGKPKIVVARIGAIGDICMLIPVVHALSRLYEVHWLIRESHVPIVRCFPAVACRLIGVPRGPDDDRLFPPRLVADLRDEAYACLIDFSHWRSVSWLARQLGEIPLRAVTQDPRQDALLGIAISPAEQREAFNRIVPVPPEARQVDKWLILLRACGIAVDLDWPLPTLPGLPAGRPLRLFVHPHAGKPEKIWPAKKFAGAVKQLAARQPLHCVVNGASRGIVRELGWRLRFAGIRSKVAALDPSFHRLRDELRDSDIAIGCDSGPMHFASLLGVPTLVIYSRYSAGEFAPLWRSTAVSPPRPGLDSDAVSIEAVSAALARLVDDLRGAPQA